MTKRLLPTGECWCQCGEKTTIGSFFLAGHDKIAESMLMQVRYGGVPEFLSQEGFGPNGKNLREAHDRWKRQGGTAR